MGVNRDCAWTYVRFNMNTNKKDVTILLFLLVLCCFENRFFI